MENEGGKKRPSKTLIVTGVLGWLLFIGECIYALTRLPVLIILAAGAGFFTLEKTLDVVLGRIFRRKPKEQIPHNRPKD
ncbi:hypothetical protein SAMN05444141_108159 [Pseudovibrio denitrificans]|uniref:Uncharacterized protein n=1 Tax=Pseudovibrio denitrificans TaxID=258256 RepID=A0A1I7DCP7_9HYPH|nr:hypothetical protein [Pseudovibrio denitrificans]SFU09502.1 hypothetical protein SAMN05444141_108159 [Pseudovibrio denitrificans]